MENVSSQSEHGSVRRWARLNSHALVDIRGIRGHASSEGSVSRSLRSDLQPAQAVSERRDHRVRVENSESMEERDIATDFQARYFYVA